MFIGCEATMGTPEDENDCETNIQSESNIANKLSINLHRQEKQYNNGLKKSQDWRYYKPCIKVLLIPELNCIPLMNYLLNKVLWMVWGVLTLKHKYHTS